MSFVKGQLVRVKYKRITAIRCVDGPSGSVHGTLGPDKVLMREDNLLYLGMVGGKEEWEYWDQVLAGEEIVHLVVGCLEPI